MFRDRSRSRSRPWQDRPPAAVAGTHAARAGGSGSGRGSGCRWPDRCARIVLRKDRTSSTSARGNRSRRSAPSTPPAADISSMQEGIASDRPICPSTLLDHPALRSRRPAHPTFDLALFAGPGQVTAEDAEPRLSRRATTSRVPASCPSEHASERCPCASFTPQIGRSARSSASSTTPRWACCRRRAWRRSRGSAAWRWSTRRRPCWSPATSTTSPPPRTARSDSRWSGCAPFRT